jgi:hypothetical protein
MGSSNGECWFKSLVFSWLGHQSALVCAPAIAFLGTPPENGHFDCVDKAISFAYLLVVIDESIMYLSHLSRMPLSQDTRSVLY